MARKQQYLRVSGRLYPDNSLFLRPCYLSENPRDSGDEPESRLQIELHGANGLLLRWGATLFEPFVDLSTSAGKAPRFLSVKAKIPFPARTRQILFRFGDLVLKEIIVPKSGPEFVGPVKVTRKNENCRIS